MKAQEGTDVDHIEEGIQLDWTAGGTLSELIVTEVAGVTLVEGTEQNHIDEVTDQNHTAEPTDQNHTAESTDQNPTAKVTYQNHTDEVTEVSMAAPESQVDDQQD